MNPIHGFAKTMAGAFSGRAAKDKAATYKQKQIETYKRDFPHLYKASTELNTESKKSGPSTDHINRRKTRQQHAVINLSKKQFNNHDRAELSDEATDKLKGKQLTFSAFEGSKEKLADLMSELSESSAKELSGKNTGKKQTVEEQVAEIKSDAYDFADMTDPKSAYLLTWHNSSHYALIIGNGVTDPQEGFSGSNRFVNWQRQTCDSVMSTMFQQAFDVQMTPLNGQHVPYTQECHLNGKPTVFELHGVNTSDMQKTWNQIQVNEQYQALSNDCTKVTARVLLSGLDEKTKKIIGAPRLGIWSAHNMDVLTSRLIKHSKDQELPEPNAPLIPDSVYEAATGMTEKAGATAVTVANDLSLSLTQWLGQKAGEFYNKLTLETV